MTTLVSRAVGGLMWAFSGRALIQIAGMGKLLLLPAIIGPEVFGLFGLVLLIGTGLDVLTKPGLETALIQRRHAPVRLLDAVWTFGLLRAGVLATAYLLVAAPLATLFGRPEATPLIRFLGVYILAGSVGNLAAVTFSRELNFRAQFRLNLFRLVEVPITLLLAYLWRSPWALLVGMTIGQTSYTVGTYVLSSHRPRLSLALGPIRRILPFSRWLFLANIVIFALIRVDDAYVAKFLGVASLGVYMLAYQISNTPATEVGHIVQSVMFPLYSRIQDDEARLRTGFSAVFASVTVLGLIVAAVIWGIAPAVVTTWFGSEWAAALGILPPLLLFGVSRAANGVCGSWLTAVARPKSLAVTAGIQLVLLLALLYPFDLWRGLIGIAWAVTIPNILVLLYLVWLIWHQIGFRRGTILGPVVVGGAISAMAFFIARGIMDFVRPVPLALPLAVIAAIIVSGIAVLIAERMRPRLWSIPVDTTLGAVFGLHRVLPIPPRGGN